MNVDAKQTMGSRWKSCFVVASRSILTSVECNGWGQVPVVSWLSSGSHSILGIFTLSVDVLMPIKHYHDGHDSWSVHLGKPIIKNQFDKCRNPSESLISFQFNVSSVSSRHLVIEKHLKSSLPGIAALQDVLQKVVTTMWDSIDPIQFVN